MSDVRIQISENGPLLVFGEVTLVDHQGAPVAPPTGKPVIALCRCGQSGNKPFCDGSHRVCGFDGSLATGAE
jgi:CDGSH-type Zn-finger protein